MTKYMKRFLTSFLTREMKIKNSLRSTIHILKWLKFKILTMSSFGKEVEGLQCSYTDHSLLVGIQNGVATLENRSAIFQKVKL